MKFSKYHGAGNDFILVDHRHAPFDEEKLSQMAKTYCARRIGVGADGLMALGMPREGGDIAMIYFNADGTLGEMCGNGSRCIARFAYELGIEKNPLVMETTAGQVVAKRLDREHYQVALNVPSVLKHHVDVKDTTPLPVSYVELGNPGLPHAVVLVADEVPLEGEALWQLGRSLRYHKAFPKGANVTFLQGHGTQYNAHTWERGVEGFTLACGTGAGSAAAVLTSLHPELAGEEITIGMPGGELKLEVTWEGDAITRLSLTGPATWVYDGETHL